MTKEQIKKKILDLGDMYAAKSKEAINSIDYVAAAGYSKLADILYDLNDVADNPGNSLQAVEDIHQQAIKKVAQMQTVIKDCITIINKV